MNSSFSTLKASFLEIVSDTLDILDQLHTASIEFTVMRDNGSMVGFESTYRCLLAEQKDRVKTKAEKIVDKCEAEIAKIEEKQLRQTVR